MPTRLNTNFAPLIDPDEFESLVRDLCALEWDDLNTQKFGRKGQKQYGVDIYGQPVDLGGVHRAAQCKLRTRHSSLTEAEIEMEVGEARHFPHRLDTLIIATDVSRDTHTQILIDQISEREVRTKGFRVVMWFWEDITERLAAYPKLIVKYYRDYFANLTTLPIVEELVESPIRVFSVGLGQLDITPLDERLILGGINVITQNELASDPQSGLVSSLAPDGLVCQFNVLASESSDSALLKLAATLRGYEQRVGGSFPAFVVLPSALESRFIECLTSLGGNGDEVQILASELPLNEISNRIYSAVFAYGYARRGGLTTTDIVVRGNPSRPSSALLDLDWHTKLNTSYFPSPSEWEEIFVPTLQAVTREVVGLGNKMRIQINCQLPLPAAFALGYFFNIRIARIGVWARKTGISNFRQQFWSSDGNPADVTCSLHWVKPIEDSCHSAVIELTTYVSIERSVENFVREVGVEPDAWLQVSLGRDVVSIDEGLAVAYASQAGRIIRQLNEQGVTDIHLFARIPSALAVLIGQRLHACGRIHLYWFENPSYRFAFTLK